VGGIGGRAEETSWRLFATKAYLIDQHMLYFTVTESAYAGFRVIELHAASKSSLGKESELGDDQLIELLSAVSHVAQRAKSRSERTSFGTRCILDR
jgi:hypothetical protein